MVCTGSGAAAGRGASIGLSLPPDGAVPGPAWAEPNRGCGRACRRRTVSGVLVNRTSGDGANGCSPDGRFHALEPSPVGGAISRPAGTFARRGSAAVRGSDPLGRAETAAVAFSSLSSASRRRRSRSTRSGVRTKLTCDICAAVDPDAGCAGCVASATEERSNRLDWIGV